MTARACYARTLSSTRPSHPHHPFRLSEPRGCGWRHGSDHHRGQLRPGRDRSGGPRARRDDEVPRQGNPRLQDAAGRGGRHGGRRREEPDGSGSRLEAGVPLQSPLPLTLRESVDGGLVGREDERLSVGIRQENARANRPARVLQRNPGGHPEQGVLRGAELETSRRPAAHQYLELGLDVRWDELQDDVAQRLMTGASGQQRLVGLQVDRSDGNAAPARAIDDALADQEGRRDLVPLPSEHDAVAGLDRDPARDEWLQGEGHSLGQGALEDDAQHPGRARPRREERRHAQQLQRPEPMTMNRAADVDADEGQHPAREHVGPVGRKPTVKRYFFHVR